ncbi:GSCFA family protein [Thalassococcus profundi]|uniref:GSCFA family protein n=1 Tax=Thalassococcus profundi TaxID=2282382 RepID=A0A369TFH1_9RHOB|nr:GSCFA domain-containing protein [Thalassococcus profundi]RDD64099.1 GSCFA family protein [Thalassococcus profundi]
MSHPYRDLPPAAFWRTAVSDINPLETTDLWTPRHDLKPDDQVVTFGSCFAQHISRALRRHGFSWLDCEPGADFVSEALRSRFNYGVFSARTGNIYSAKALLQWVQWSLGQATPPDEAWERKGRYYDPFRPAIEPDGFASAAEMLASRQQTLDAFARCIRESDVFVFTLGLTESWENIAGGYTYATCPGTNAGTFDPDSHVFRNYTCAEVQDHLEQALTLIRAENPKVRILLTVSPVPLTATAAGKHVVVSTTYSKSVLRAVAGAVSDAWDHVDYFPSYEIITAPSFRGMFYDPNMRTVAGRGVDFVMSHFMAGVSGTAPGTAPDVTEGAAKPAAPPPDRAPAGALDEPDDIKCEEQILEAFARH